MVAAAVVAVAPRHRARPRLRPTQNKMALVNLATGEKKEFDKVRRFAFNGDKPTWIAMQSYPEAGGADDGAPAAGAAGRGAARRRGRGGRSSYERH